jgi:hypothetical protein
MTTHTAPSFNTSIASRIISSWPQDTAINAREFATSNGTVDLINENHGAE